MWFCCGHHVQDGLLVLCGCCDFLLVFLGFNRPGVQPAWGSTGLALNRPGVEPAWGSTGWGSTGMGLNHQTTYY